MVLAASPNMAAWRSVGEALNGKIHCPIAAWLTSSDQLSRIPSILWQLFWSWIFAPCILWKIRKIREIHYWRLQITICVIAA